MELKPACGLLSFSPVLILMVVILFTTGCDSPASSDSGSTLTIPEKWQGTYKMSGADYMNIGTNSLIYTSTSGLNTTINNVSIQYGGTVKPNGGTNVVGEWVYLVSNGTKIGFLIQDSIETVAGIGNGAITCLYWIQVQWELSPVPSLNISSTISFYASKQKTVTPPNGNQRD